jgi:hypothetical protein
MSCHRYASPFRQAEIPIVVHESHGCLWYGRLRRLGSGKYRHGVRCQVRLDIDADYGIRDGKAALILGSLRTDNPSTSYNGPNHIHADRRHCDQLGIIRVDVVPAAFNDPVATDDQSRNTAY